MISDEQLKRFSTGYTVFLHADGVEMAKELLALRNQPAIQPYKLPAGWRLVPDEPSEEMIDAWRHDMEK